MVTTEEAANISGLEPVPINDDGTSSPPNKVQYIAVGIVGFIIIVIIVVVVLSVVVPLVFVFKRVQASKTTEESSSCRMTINYDGKKCLLSGIVCICKFTTVSI